MARVQTTAGFTHLEARTEWQALVRMQGETLVYNNSDISNCGPNNIIDQISCTNSENKIQSIHNINSLPDLPIQSLFRSISVKQGINFFHTLWLLSCLMPVDCSILKAAFAHARRSILCTESSQYIEVW